MQVVLGCEQHHEAATHNRTAPRGLACGQFARGLTAVWGAALPCIDGTHHGERQDVKDVKEAMEAFHQRLRDAGLKSTRQRDVIVETFFKIDKHISVDELLVEARKQSPRIGYATVYRTMKLLVEQGLANQRRFDDGQTRYDPEFDKEQHDHLICVDCRRIIEFDDDEVLARLNKIAAGHGLKLRRRSVEIYGECQVTDCPHKAN